MRKRVIGFAISAMLFALWSSAEAQQPKKVARIGYLSTFDPATESARSEAIRGALRELGYVEGQNITFEYRYVEGKQDRASGFAVELTRLKVDMIVVAGGEGMIQAVKNVTKTIPIVMVGAGADPVETGLVENLARPGGNVTGLSNLTPALGGKRLELLKEAVPKLARLAVLYDPTLPGIAREVKEDLPVAARALKLILQPWGIRDADEFDKVFASMGKERSEGLYVPGGPTINPYRKRSVGLALKTRLPSVYGSRLAAEVGGLMSYGADATESYRRVAYYVDRILKGAKPADLPVEQPTKFELVINLKTAKQIGMTIPANLLLRANSVIR
jgi:ABC-type uncharacterized transport system substrate-binding protein